MFVYFAEPAGEAVLQDRCEKRDKAGVEIEKLLGGGLLTSHFQPIVSLQQYEVFAYEALCRTVCPNPFGSIDILFHQATQCGLTLPLDMQCRTNGIALASGQSILDRGALLFINICPTSLLHPGHSAGKTVQLAQQHGLPVDHIVLEITEHEAISNYNLFRRAIDHYRSKGFRIAIDDFGAGYGGLKMLSVIEPDFVKIDRHFFLESKKSSINFNLIDSIATACHRIGIKVIAEGIEQENDLRTCREIGIDLVQGYLLARPSATLLTAGDLHLPEENHLQEPDTKLFDEVICIGDLATPVPPLDPGDRTIDVLKRFNQDGNLLCLPIVKNDQLCGLINRREFMETHMVGRFGYGLNLNYYKKIEEILEEDFLQVPHSMPVEEVARKIKLRRKVAAYDDICITRSGKYFGVVSVSAILDALTETSIRLARGANPLTGLPGNEHIQRRITAMLSQSMHFDVCYIDIDNFKPFNDRHGFAMGDRVIKAIAELAAGAVAKWEGEVFGFAGHIGGDDFILVTRPKNSECACRDIIDGLERMLESFHPPEEIRLGHYASRDRQGNERHFNLLSLSIGIVSTEIYRIGSFAEISSIASELKKMAKEVSGSVIIRDRRG